MATLPARYRFTVKEYHRMGKAGIFTEDDRVELLDGEIVEMAAIGKRHAYTVLTLNELFTDQLRRRAVVSPQNPLSLGETSEPQPDLMLLVPPAARYRDRLPQPSDVLLLIEVADTSAAFERRVKLPLYARAGVREVWLVDLKQGIIQVFRQPSLGGYLSVTRVTKGERLAPEAFPDLTLTSDEVLG
jgi:Uma2 family endonuclease